MYISILLIEKNSIYFLFKNCEKVIKIQNETALLIDNILSTRASVAKTKE